MWKYDRPYNVVGIEWDTPCGFVTWFRISKYGDQCDKLAISTKYTFYAQGYNIGEGKIIAMNYIREGTKMDSKLLRKDTVDNTDRTVTFDVEESIGRFL